MAKSFSEEIRAAAGICKLNPKSYEYEIWLATEVIHRNRWEQLGEKNLYTRSTVICLAW